MSTTQNRFILRPLELKHLFDFAIRLLRFNFVPMFLSMAMVQLPLALIGIPLSLKMVAIAEKFQDPSFMTNSSGMDIWNSIVLEFGDIFLFLILGMIGAALYQLLVTPLGLLTCSRLAARALDGHRDDFGSAFRFALSRYWPTQVALATFFLPTVLLALLILIMVLIAQASGSDSAIIVIASTGVFLIWAASIATMLMYFRFFPALCGALQACEEGPDPGMVAQGVWYLKRAFSLSQGYYGRIFLMMLMMYIVWYMFNGGLQSTIELLVMLYDYMSSGSVDITEYITQQAEGNSDPLRMGLQMSIMHIVMLIFPPLWQCYKLLLYVDLRCRREAFDIYQLVESDEAGEDMAISAPQ
ncbi:MAG: hypothetical protein H7A35_15955 [Planctomycetales bacterium]|nr:hypothetical protein [bacterium]UNM08322.1 MAG: hypothetical protein H7A35_15955 [Planctomycetales bacterium]